MRTSNLVLRMSPSKFFFAIVVPSTKYFYIHVYFNTTNYRFFLNVELFLVCYQYSSGFLDRPQKFDDITQF